MAKFCALPNDEGPTRLVVQCRSIARYSSMVSMVLCSQTAGASIAFAQPPALCIPGTAFCTRTNAGAGVQAGARVQGQAGVDHTSARVNANANADANANAGAQTNTQANVGIGGSGRAQADARGTGNGASHAESPRRHYRASTPMRFGAGVTFCGTLKAGIHSGFKAGPCFAVSFRTEPLTFEMETQLLFGGTRHTVDWVFPMSFVIPLTSQRSLYEGLQLRVGGSPIGATFAKSSNGGNYLRFGLHAGLSYEYSLGRAATWRVFDVRSFLDFGTKREVDPHHHFIDFGGQLSTGIVL